MGYSPPTTTQKLHDLRPDPKNPNRGTGRGRRAVKESLAQYGAGRSIVLDAKGRILAGNKTAEAALELGLDDVIIIPSDGTKLIAVQRTDLDLDSDTDTRAHALRISDNRASELGLNWSFTQLAEDVEGGLSFPDSLFDANELSALMARVADGLKESAEVQRPQVFGEPIPHAEGANDSPAVDVPGDALTHCPECGRPLDTTGHSTRARMNRHGRNLPRP